MKNKLLLALALLVGFVVQANAASRFWNPYIVSGAVSGTAGVCRLTISPAITGSGLVGGTTVHVTNITGATGCNVDATISTIVDSTHIELTGTTFGGVYASGGCVSGGQWTSTNTSNWAGTTTATCGSGGSSVPGSSDAVTFDANSVGGTVVPNYDMTVQSIDMGSFTNGTLDFSVNNNNPTLNLSGVVMANSSANTRALNLGNGLWTLSGAAAAWSQSNVTGLTFNSNSSEVKFTSSAMAASLHTGTAKNFNKVTFAGTGRADIGNTNFTIATLSIAAGNLIYFNAGSTLTLTNAPTFTGICTAPIVLVSNGQTTAATISVASGTFMLDYGLLAGITGTGGATFTATHTYDYKGNTGISISGTPSCAGGGFIIGG